MNSMINAGPCIIEINTSFHYAFEPRPPKFEKNFPSKIDLDNIDVFTQDTFKDQFLQAQRYKLPYYLLSVVELKKMDNSSIYKIYSSLSLRAHQFECIKNGKDFFCPETKLTIKRIHYFALNCFTFQRGLDNKIIEFMPTEVKDIKVCKCFFPQVYDEQKDVHLALDALNFHVDVKDLISFAQLKDRQRLISLELKSRSSKIQEKIQNKYRNNIENSKKVSKPYRLNKLHTHLVIERQKWEYCKTRQEFFTSNVKKISKSKI